MESPGSNLSIISLCGFKGKNLGGDPPVSKSNDRNTKQGGL